MTLLMPPLVRLDLRAKRVCFWGAPATVEIQPGDAVPWRARLDQTGGNTGNLFIGHGLFHSTDALIKSYHPGFGVLPASEFDDHFDYLLIPASNFVNPALDLEPIFNYFRQTRVQILCFGLGSQVIPGKALSLQAGTEAFIRLISERSGSIGIRGSHTAEMLWSLGIHNISLTGCPSLLGLDDATVNQLVTTRPTFDKVAVNYSNNVRGHSFNTSAQKSTENALFYRLLDENSYYILQNEAAELSVLDAIVSKDNATFDRDVQLVARMFSCTDEISRVRAYAQRLRVFYNIPQWVGAMRTMTATVGTRFHGNIASILAGTPGMVLVHDMRTRELAELFNIPHLLLDRSYAAEDVLERLLAIDYGPFAIRLGQLRSEWRMFLYRNGIGSVFAT